MMDNKLYDYLQSLLPAGMQFVDAYNNISALPPPRTDWASMTVVDIDDIGWSQDRNTDYDDTTGIILVQWDIQRIYNVRFDFYGKNAFNNCAIFKQSLQVALATKQGLADLKEMSEIRNLTFLQESKDYEYRYQFDCKVFVVDTITTAEPAVERAVIDSINHYN